MQGAEFIRDGRAGAPPTDGSVELVQHLQMKQFAAQHPQLGQFSLVNAAPGRQSPTPTVGTAYASCGMDSSDRTAPWRYLPYAGRTAERSLRPGTGRLPVCPYVWDARWRGRACTLPAVSLPGSRRQVPRRRRCCYYYCRPSGLRSATSGALPPPRRSGREYTHMTGTKSGII